MPNIGTTLLDRLLGQTQGLGIATLPSVPSAILVPTLIFPYPCRFSGGLLSTRNAPFLAQTLSDAALDTKVKIVLSPRYDTPMKNRQGLELAGSTISHFIGC